jgi:hypothetical protein
MKVIKFVPSHTKVLALELIPGWISFKRCRVYEPVYTTLTACEKSYRSNSMSDDNSLTFDEWRRASNLTYSDVARLVPCSISYPRMWAHGLARPSYEMACRIEEVSEGLVRRTQWYPSGETESKTSNTTDVAEDLLK